MRRALMNLAMRYGTEKVSTWLQIALGVAMAGVIASSITRESLMNGLVAIAFYAVMVAAYSLYVAIYKVVTGRDPEEVYMERLMADPVFGPAYASTANDARERYGVLRAYNGCGLG